MIAITGLAAMTLRIVVVLQLLAYGFWLAASVPVVLEQSAGAELLTSEVLIPVLGAVIWIALLVWAHPICRILAGPLKDKTFDAGFTRQDAVRFTVLAAAVLILVQAAAAILTLNAMSMSLLFNFGPLISGGLGLVLLILSLAPDALFRRLAIFAPAPKPAPSGTGAGSEGQA
jgi:hypothetical protein